MTPNTMTLDEVRDELARRDGWKHIAEPTDEWDVDTRSITMYPEHWIHASTNDVAYCHPHPATLDGAAAALITAYVWGRYIDDPEVENGWYAWKRSFYNTMQSVPDTGDELLDRYRLALSCRIAEEGK